MSLKTVFLLCAFPVIFLMNSCREDTWAGASPRDTAVLPERGATENGPPEATSARYDTILIEGRKQAVKLTPYSEPNYGIKTFIPGRDFIPQLSASGEGMAVKFTANFGGVENSRAHVNIFFPVGNPGLDQLRDMTIGPRGLMAMNKWRLIKSFKKPAVPYSWAQEQYTFQYKDGQKYSSGAVFIGESQGRPVQVTMIYPAEYGDGFPPRAAILLKHLKFSPLHEPGF